MLKLAFSGLMYSGKDHVAGQAGCTVVSASEPLARLARHLFGTDDKTIPSIRQFMTTVGQWGWGAQDRHGSPYTCERALFAEWARQRGAEVTRLGEPAMWWQFGRRPDFWLMLMEHRLREEPEFAGVKRLAMVNCRFPHDRRALEATGWRHYLVACTDNTREQRLGRPFTNHERNDISEVYARAWSGRDSFPPHLAADWEGEACLPASRVIWNDAADTRYVGEYRYGSLTVPEFVASLEGLG
jgi:hypothetical protein